MTEEVEEDLLEIDEPASLLDPKPILAIAEKPLEVALPAALPTLPDGPPMVEYLSVS